MNPRWTQFFLPSLALFFIWVPAGNAQTLFDRTSTGQELTTNPSVIFYGNPVVQGDSIILTSDGDSFLFDWALLGPEPKGDLVVRITVDYTPMSDDNDPTLGLHDLVNQVGYGRADNNGGTLFKREGVVSGINLPNPPTGPFGPVDMGPVETFSMTFTLTDDSGPTLFEFMEGSDRHTDEFVENPLDSDQPLLFLWGGATPGEIYQIHSVSIRITEVVPNSGLVYFPLTHCRVVNTRRMDAGKLGANERRQFIARGETTNLSSQGGVATGCGIPEQAEAIAAKFWVFQHEGPGYLRAGAAGQNLSNGFGTSIQYSDLDEVSYINSSILDLCDNRLCPDDFQVETRGKAGTHLAIDVMGYFAPLDMATQSVVETATQGLRLQLEQLSAQNQQLERELRKVHSLEKDVQRIQNMLNMPPNKP